MTEKSEKSLFDEFDMNSFLLDDEDDNSKKPVDGIVKDDTEEEIDEEDEILDGTLSDESDDDNSGYSSSSYQVLAKALSEEGVLSISEDELKDVNDAEKIIGLVQKEINTRVDEYKSTLPNEIKELLDNYEEGIDLESLLNTKKEQLSFAKIKEEDLDENESLMKKVIAKDLEMRGMSQEDIDEEIEDIFSLGKETTRSKKALANINKRLADKETAMREQAKQDEISAKKMYQERLSNMRKTVDDTKELAGIPISKKIQDDAFKAMTTVVAEVQGSPINAITKTRLENPVEFDAKVALLYSLTNGFTKWDAFGKTAKTKALSELDKIAERMAREKEAGTPSRRRSEILGAETVLSDIDFNSIKQS